MLSLRSASPASREKARKKATEKLAEVRGKIRALKQLEATLGKLIRDCQSGEASSPCPILERLEGAWRS